MSHVSYKKSRRATVHQSSHELCLCQVPMVSSPRRLSLLRSVPIVQRPAAGDAGVPTSSAFTHDGPDGRSQRFDVRMSTAASLFLRFCCFRCLANNASAAPASPMSSFAFCGRLEIALMNRSYLDASIRNLLLVLLFALAA